MLMHLHNYDNNITKLLNNFPTDTFEVVYLTIITQLFVDSSGTQAQNEDALVDCTRFTATTNCFQRSLIG